MNIKRIISEDELSRDHFLSKLKTTEDFNLRQAYDAFNHLYQQMQQSKDGTRRGIVGMEDFIEAMLMILITGQNLLIRGVPGLAKTRAVLLLASLLGVVFRRIQSTPDLMPSDMQYREQLVIDDKGKHKIEWYPGPVFSNLVLNDEIDRATPKTQSALLEVMEEKKVSVHGRGRYAARPMKSISDKQEIDEAEQLEKLHKDDENKKLKGYFDRKKINPENKDELALFFIATQNGIEQEGTYPLPEAQMDRFLFMTLLDNPPQRHLEGIAADSFIGNNSGINPTRFLNEHLKTVYFLVMVKEKLLSESARQAFFQTPVWHGISDLWECTHLNPTRDGYKQTNKGLEVRNYIKASPGKVHLQAVRELMERPQNSDLRMPRIELGASPRGLLGLIRAAHAQALLENSFENGELKVLWSHVEKVAPMVLRHRIKLNQADIHRSSSDYVIENLLACFRNHF